MASKNTSIPHQEPDCLRQKQIALACATQLPWGIIRMADGVLHLEGWASNTGCPCQQWAISLLRSKKNYQTSQIASCDCGHWWVVRAVADSTSLVIGPLRTEGSYVFPKKHRDDSDVQVISKKRLQSLVQLLEMVAAAPMAPDFVPLTLVPTASAVNPILPASPYPMALESELLQALQLHNQQDAQNLVNRLYNHIFLTSQPNFIAMKTNLGALVVLISHTISQSHASPENIRQIAHQALYDLDKIQSLETLCHWTTSTINLLLHHHFFSELTAPNDVVTSIMTYVQHNFQEKITLDFVATVVHLSTAHIGRLFKKETGQSFTQFLTHVRIAKSKELLAEPNLRLVDIAQMVGFEDQSYFTRVFKRYTGETPLTFRDQLIHKTTPEK